MTRIVVHGAGRMGQRILALVAQDENLQLAGCVSKPVPGDRRDEDWVSSLDDLESGADLLIDFTLPGGTADAAAWCAREGVALLSGTTGLTEQDISALDDAARSVPVLWAPNLSFGVALATSLVRQVAAALGPDTRIHVRETHHVHKLDAPSGTALALARAALEGGGPYCPGAEGVEGLADVARGRGGELEFESIREGEVVGDHTVRFEVADETIEITHRASDRDVFARGALKAGEWLVGQPPGRYTTADWLGQDRQPAAW